MKESISIVTGASSGLGRSIATLLCAEGHKVYVVARRENLLEELKTDCSKHAGKIIPFPGDLSDKTFRETLISTVLQNEKRIDYLFNNASFGRSIQFEKQDSDEIQNMINVNVTAYVHLTKLVLRPMKKKNSGRIIHTGSVVAFTPLAYFALYNTTKTAIYAFNRSLRYELKDTNVSSTIVLPSRMKTGFAKTAYNCYEKNGQMICVNKFNESAGDPMIVARKIVKKMNKGKETIVPTFRAKLSYLARYFGWIVDLVNKNIMGPKELRHLRQAHLKTK